MRSARPQDLIRLLTDSRPLKFRLQTIQQRFKPPGLSHQEDDLRLHRLDDFCQSRLAVRAANVVRSLMKMNMTYPPPPDGQGVIDPL